MNRRDLIRLLLAAGFRLSRTLGPHDSYKRDSDGRVVSVPRHRMIKKGTALAILRDAGLR